MEWFNDPKVIIFLVGVAVNAAMFAVIKFNDLRHLGKKVDVIVNKQEEMSKDIVDTKERISKIEGKLEAYED